MCRETAGIRIVEDAGAEAVCSTRLVPLRAATKVKLCKALGCTVDVAALGRRYNAKKKLCELHLKASELRCNGKGDSLFRYCQQCGKLESLELFSGNKRSCRAALARRRSQSTQQRQQQQQHLPYIVEGEHEGSDDQQQQQHGGSSSGLSSQWQVSSGTTSETAVAAAATSERAPGMQMADGNSTCCSDDSGSSVPQSVAGAATAAIPQMGQQTAAAPPAGVSNDTRQAAVAEAVMSGPVMQTRFFEALLQQELANGSYDDGMQCCADAFQVFDVEMGSADGLTALLELELLNAAEASAVGCGSVAAPAAGSAVLAPTGAPPATHFAAAAGSAAHTAAAPAAVDAAGQAAFQHQAWLLQQQLEEQRQLALRQQQLAEQLQQHRQARLLLQQQLMARQHGAATAAPASCSTMGMTAGVSCVPASSLPLCMLPPAAVGSVPSALTSALLPVANSDVPFGGACYSSSNMMMDAAMSLQQQQQPLVFPGVPVAPVPAPFLASETSFAKPAPKVVTDSVSNMPVRAGVKVDELMSQLAALRNEFQAMESSLLQLKVFDGRNPNAAGMSASGATACGTSCAAGMFSAGGITMSYQQQQQLHPHAQCWQQQQQIDVGSCGVFSNGVTFFV